LRIEAWLIRRALEEHGGRRAATARTLCITDEGSTRTGDSHCVINPWVLLRGTRA